MESSKKLGMVIGTITLIIFTFVLVYKNVFYDESKDKRRMSDEEERRQSEELIKRKQEEKKPDVQDNNQEIDISQNDVNEEQKIKEEQQKELEKQKEEEQREEEQRKYREYIAQEELKEKEIFKEENIISKLSKYSFKEVQDDKCRSGQRCFINDDYHVSVENGFVYFDKKVTKDEVLNYDCTNDLIMFKDIFEKDNLPKLNNKINYFIRIFPLEGLSSINFKFNRLSVYLSYYGSDLHFRVSRDVTIDDSFEIKYVDSIIDKQPVKIDLINERKRDLYNFLIEDNKNYFVFYDYFYNYFNDATLDVCSIDISGKDYILHSSFCHGGTSNTYFQIEKKGYYNDEKFSVRNDFKGDYFRTNAVNIITNDLKYFSSKTGNQYELSDDHINKINEYISNNSTSLDLVINDSMSINITYKPNNYYKDYYLLYIIK